jgi:hypothetical protein
MMFRSLIKDILVFTFVLCVLQVCGQRSSPPPVGGGRGDLSLNSNWYSIANDSNQHAYDGFENASFNTTAWQQVNVPHNWDAYEGYRRLHHGNRHGYAWYRRTFTVASKEKSKRYFLWFEGVGSFATVWVNGKKAGEHAGGRTTFTIDVTDLILDNNQPNLLAVRADHPANINTLPWVCGGCSDERGFSEGSQPMGIFRPVHLITTNAISCLQTSRLIIQTGMDDSTVIARLVFCKLIFLFDQNEIKFGICPFDLKCSSETHNSTTYNDYIVLHFTYNNEQAS